MAKRLDNLRARFAENQLDAMLVTRPENQLYLSGFTGGDHDYLDATLLISADQAWVSTDSRYYEDVKQRATGWTLFEAGYDKSKALGEFGAKVKPKVVGYEPTHLTVATLKEWNKVARKAGFKLQATNGLVEALRVIKEPDELAKIKRAVDLTDAAFAHFLTVVKPSMTEKEAVWVLETYFHDHGAERMAFCIVGSGPNAALPHAIPGDRKLQRGEPIVVDFGCSIDHYHSDLTRTICLGQADAQFRTVYDVVLKANKNAERKIKADVKGKRADSFARNIIDKAGYVDRFGHSLGHGVGLAVHEAPRASRTSKDIYRPNMTLTIEPGIYIPGWGGVRIEDLVVIRENDVEILSQATKEPVVKV